MNVSTAIDGGEAINQCFVATQSLRQFLTLLYSIIPKTQIIATVNTKEWPVIGSHQSISSELLLFCFTLQSSRCS
jgi:hypothetical protein